MHPVFCVLTCLVYILLSRWATCITCSIFKATPPAKSLQFDSAFHTSARYGRQLLLSLSWKSGRLRRGGGSFLFWENVGQDFNVCDAGCYYGCVLIVVGGLAKSSYHKLNIPTYNDIEIIHRGRWLKKLRTWQEYMGKISLTRTKRE